MFAANFHSRRGTVVVEISGLVAKEVIVDLAIKNKLEGKLQVRIPEA